MGDCHRDKMAAEELIAADALPLDANVFTFPTPGDKLQIHYTARLAAAPDSAPFAYSCPSVDHDAHEPNESAQLELRRSNECCELTLGAAESLRSVHFQLLKMHLGEKKTVTIAAEDAFGGAGVDGLVPSNAALLFELEVVSICGKKAVTSLQELAQYESQLDSWCTSKEDQYSNDADFREKQHKKHKDREGYMGHLERLKGSKMNMHAGALQLQTQLAEGPPDLPQTVDDAIRKVRIYLCPFVVCKHLQALEGEESAEGRGIVFVKSPNSMNELFFHCSVDQLGRRLERSLFCEHFTVEKLAKLAEAEPVLEPIMNALEESAASYEPEKSMVIAFLSGCGYLTIRKVVLTPDFGVSMQLSVDYKDKDKIQLNID